MPAGPTQEGGAALAASTPKDITTAAGTSGTATPAGTAGVKC